MTAADAKPAPVRLAIDASAEDAIAGFARALGRASGDSPRVVDHHDLGGGDGAVTHLGVWYLYKSASPPPDPARTVVTIHHLLRWNDTMDDLVRQGVSLVTMSSEWFRYLRRRVPRGRLSIVPHGVDPEVWRPPARRRVPGKPLHVGVVGRVYPEDGRKGERLLPRLFSPLPSGRFRLTIIGTGWEDVVGQLRKAGADVNHLTRLPPGELCDAVSTFDVFLCTSDVEGGPLPLLEAMASGVTPVSTPVGLARDLLAGTGLGYLFPKGNASVARAVLAGLQSGNLPFPDPSRLRQAACRVSWANAAGGYRAIYQAVRRGGAVPEDPTGYLPWLQELRGARRLTWRERLALVANPRPTERWTQPLAWRAWNKLARSVSQGAG